MENIENKSLYEIAEDWLRSISAVWITESTLAKRLGISEFQAGAVADALQMGGCLSENCIPYGQRKNLVRRRSGGKRGKK